MERRKYPRVIRRLPITFSDGETEVSGTSSDFCSIGLFIRTRKAFKPGTVLKMALDVDGKSKIALTGRVIWSVKTRVLDFKNGMGIELTSIPQTYKDFVKDLH